MSIPSFNTAMTAASIKHKGCLCSNFHSSELLEKLSEILINLEQEMQKKNGEIKKLNQYYQSQLKNKDEIIERLAKACEKLSQENEQFKAKNYEKKQKTRNVGPYRINRQKGNISQLMTVDNSFGYRTEAAKDYGKIDKKYRKFYRDLNVNGARQQRKNCTWMQNEQQHIKKVCSSTFINNNFSNLDYLPRKKITHQRNSSQNLQDMYPYESHEYQVPARSQNIRKMKN